MSPPTAGKPAAWAHQDALVLAVKRLLHGEATLDSLDAYVTLALQEPRVAYKALCGCVTHHLLVKVKRRQHRLTLLQLLSKVCEQATAALGPHNVFGAHAHVALRCGQGLTAPCARVPVERFKPDVARCVACTCRGASEEALVRARGAVRHVLCAALSRVHVVDSRGGQATVSAIVDNWALLEVFSGAHLQSCYDAVERKGQVEDVSSQGVNASRAPPRGRVPSRSSWSELSLFAPAEQPQAADAAAAGAHDGAGAAGEPPQGGGASEARPMGSDAMTLAPPTAAAPAARQLPPAPLERVPTPGGGDDPYRLYRPVR
jgi:hypothetical protein